MYRWMNLESGWSKGQGRVGSMYLGWVFGEKAIYLMFALIWDDERGWGIHLGIPFLFNLYFYMSDLFPSPPWRFDEYSSQWRVFSFSLSFPDWFLTVDIYNEFSSSRRHWAWFLKDMILGQKKRISYRTIDHFVDYIKLPEEDYVADCDITESIYKRRFTRAEVIFHVNATFPIPIPIPGKGESAWDLEDDAIFEISIYIEGGKGFRSGLQNWATGSLIKRRERYGGKNWMPSED